MANTKDKKNVILLAAGAFAVVLAIDFCLIAFTPLRTLIPGYPNAETRRQNVETALMVDSLQIALSRWELYSENLSRALSGQQTISLDSLKTGGKEYMSRNPDRRQDSILRAAVADEALEAEIEKKLRTIPIEGLHFFPPLKGNVSLGYDESSHPAVDIVAAKDQLVCATLEGTVLFAGWNDENGYTVIIQHPGNIVSSYSHCQRILKQKGEKVKAGTAIALAGTTGSSSERPQLHFELWYNGRSLNPTDYIKL